MPSAITFQQMSDRVAMRGMVCNDGVWRPYQLVEASKVMTGPATIQCPKYGQFTVSNLFDFCRQKGGHPLSEQERREATTLSRFGVKNAFQSEQVKLDIQARNLKTYGVRFSSQRKEVAQKKKATCLFRYGTDTPLGSNKVKQKIAATNLQRRGVVNPFLDKKVQAAIKMNHLAKYGHQFIGQVPSLIEKRKQTNLARYGHTSPLHNEKILRNTNQKIEQMMVEGTWGTRFGRAQSELKTWLEEQTGKVFVVNRTILSGRELDLYNDELKLAIEYCGLHWHNEHSPTPRPRGYHFDKYKRCSDLGIRLITIFEDEWLVRNSQVKNYLRSVLQVHDQTIYARKCQFVALEKAEASNFLDLHHIQGAANRSTFHFGLYYEAQLVAVMTFGKHHRKTNELVLDRFAVGAGVSLPGGASKLFKNALPLIPKVNIKSWSDNRWSQGNVYKQLGFVHVADNPPDYSYVVKNRRVRLSKQSQQKKKTGCPPDQTEYQWCLEKGLLRIWDCGKKVWVFQRQAATSTSN